MGIIHDNDSVLMSDSLQGNLRDEKADDVEGKFIIAILSVIVGTGIEAIVGTIVSYTNSKDKCTLQARVLSEDAFSLIDSWHKIKLEKYQLSLGDNILDFSGPFSMTSFMIKDVEANRQLCTIEVKLEKV